MNILMDAERTAYLDSRVKRDFAKEVIDRGRTLVFVISTEERKEERDYVVQRMQEELMARGFSRQEVGIEGHTLCGCHNARGGRECPRNVDAYSIELDYFVNLFEESLQEKAVRAGAA